MEMLIAKEAETASGKTLPRGLDAASQQGIESYMTLCYGTYFAERVIGAGPAIESHKQGSDEAWR
jgi:hypothetical protein